MEAEWGDGPARRQLKNGGRCVFLNVRSGMGESN